MQRKKLPIGIQTFREIREEGYYYVDKTSFACRLANEGKYYFLSRPRRFGKSLFLDTLKELFEGNEALFRGLHIHDRWDWSKKYPVIRISFSDGVLNSREKLDEKILEILEREQKKIGVKCVGSSISGIFSELIEEAFRQHGHRVVVLIDEYDKPILDNIEDTAVASAMREGLKNFYSVIKGADPHLKFVLLTGVSKFSKVSLFSGLNNLIDITLDKNYSALCGYTERDVDEVFAPEVEGMDREEIREWYNGYNWLGEAVYNPFDLLLLFRNKEFKPYWFETGTPAFLVKLLGQRKTWLPSLDQIFTSEKLISTFDVDNIPTEALMFQAGYLTIKNFHQIPGRLEIGLGYPNKEVKSALNDSLLLAMVGNDAGQIRSTSRAYAALLKNDLLALGSTLTSFFASIPYQWHTNNDIAEYEGYYASVFYAYFASLGLDIAVEESSHAGRLDMAVRFNGHIYLFEFKVVELEPAGRALEQIKERCYADKYQDTGLPIHLIGVEFSKERRQVVGFESESKIGSLPPRRFQGVANPSA
jgi:hypothetical protein